ncbi:hypothetical protein Tco_0215622 [Tanacetum coccineum]
MKLSIAWERFKGLLRQCPHHGFSELHQLDTSNNSLNPRSRRFRSAAGGKFSNKVPRIVLAIIGYQQHAASPEYKWKFEKSRLEKMISEKNVTTLATDKAVKEVVLSHNCGFTTTISAIVN